VTFSVYKRRRLLDLPDHVHALVWLPNPEGITRFLHGWKRMSSFRIRQWYAAHAANYFAGFGPGERFWQPKSYVFHVHSERKLRQRPDYMHTNPVKAGLVQRTEDWRWSSARWYTRQQSVGVPITWIDGRAQVSGGAEFCPLPPDDPGCEQPGPPASNRGHGFEEPK